MAKNSKPMQKKQAMDRYHKAYSVEDVFTWIKNSKGTKENPMPKRVEMDGHKMKVYSLRYENFMAHGVKCCKCGVEGSVFYKERNFTVAGKPVGDNGEYHFNLYAILDGEEILMTKDHIIAKSLGGKDTVENMQPMCVVCNGIKSSMTQEEWDNYELPKQPTKHERYLKAKEIADQYGKKVFVIPSLNNRFIVAKDLDDANRGSYHKHIAELYEAEK